MWHLSGSSKLSPEPQWLIDLLSPDLSKPIAYHNSLDDFRYLVIALDKQVMQNEIVRRVSKKQRNEAFAPLNTLQVHKDRRRSDFGHDLHWFEGSNLRVSIWNLDAFESVA